MCVSRPGESIDSLDGLELLAKTDRRVLRADLVGTGDSEAYASGSVAEDAAAELSAVLRKAGVKKCHFFCAGAGAARVAGMGDRGEVAPGGGGGGKGGGGGFGGAGGH